MKLQEDKISKVSLVAIAFQKQLQLKQIYTHL
jgi:hypothetical protein